MKKALAVAALALLALVVVIFSTHVSEKEITLAEEVAKSDTLYPPKLAISSAYRSIPTNRGTYTWKEFGQYGTSRSASLETLHPLDAQRYTPVLRINAADSAQNVTLAFEAGMEADSVSVRAWDTAYWGADDSAPSVKVPVTQDDEGRIGFALLSYDAVYEVHAVWDSADDYSGDAYYSFATSIE